MTNACCTETDTICLSVLKPGSRGKIKKFLVDCDDKTECRFCHRLKEMGLHEGARFEVITNDGNGGVTAVFEDARIVLGRGMASKIIVDVLSGSSLEDSVVTRLCRRFGIGCK